MPIKLYPTENNQVSTTAKSSMMCGDAGDVRLTYRGDDFTAPFADEPFILCSGESMTVAKVGTIDTTNDPNPSTDPTIGYVFYECRPTIEGPDLANILSDCVFNSANFLSDVCAEDGQPHPIELPIADEGIWIFADENVGVFDPVTFTNTGRLNTGFGYEFEDPTDNRDCQPTTFWFAPITLHRLGNFGEPGFEGTPVGSCINVSVDQAFAVTYLNDIEIEVRPPIASLPCRGRFTVRGGLPELNGGDYTDISITLQDDPSVEADLLTPGIENGETATFEVSQSGIYEIVVTDAQGCMSAIATVDMTGCETVAFTAPDVVGRPNQTICTDVTVADFSNILGFDFSIEWDPSIVSFNDLINLNPNLGGDFNTNSANLGVLSVTWQETVDLNNGTTIAPEDSVLFTICFNVIGNDGEVTDLTFTNTNASNSGNGGQEIGLLSNNGSVIISDNSIGVDLTARDISCNGEVDGGFVISVVGGTAPYEVTLVDTLDFNTPLEVIILNQEGETDSIKNQGAGAYAVIVIDSTNPVDIDTVRFEVVEPGLLSGSLNVDPPTCTGTDDAVITVSLARGDSPPVPIPASELANYNFMWAGAPNLPSTARLTDLAPGFYSVTVTDPNGCTFEGNTVVSDPLIQPNATITRATCTTSSNGNGAIEFVPTSPSNGPGDSFTFDLFKINPDGTSSSIVEGILSETFFVGGLNPCPYEYIITDANGCSLRDTLIVDADKELIVEVIDSTNVSCAGGNDAFIEVMARAEGTPAAGAWTFEWTGVPPLEETPTINDDESRAGMLRAGVYTLRVTDSDPAGCEAFVSYNITEPVQLTADDIMTTAETCNNNGGDGTASISVSGGIRPYTFVWEDMVSTTDTIRSDLSAGPYTVTIQDANNCEVEVQLTVGSPTAPAVIIEPDTVTCITDMNGALTANVIPGSAPIASVEWTVGASTITGQTITGLAPGSYVVTVTGTDNCTTIDTGFVFAPESIRFDSLVSENPSCPGFDDGQLRAFLSGGTEPYQYEWRNAGTGDVVGNNAVLAGLVSGDFILEITDANNCATRDTMITLAEPPSILIDTMQTVTVAVSCNSGVPCDGSATIFASYSDGSPGNFNFQWESGETTEGATSSTAVELCQGFQSITITDGEICSILDSVFIDAPEALRLDVNATPVTCFGDTDGTATVFPGGGTPNYTVTWDDATTGDTNQDLSPGTYAVSVVDANSCEFSTNVTIGEPDSLIAQIGADQTRDVTCAGSSDGAIFIVAMGGNDLQEYTYEISPMAGSGDADLVENLPPGDYTITVTDIRGCVDTTSHTVREPEAIEVDNITIPQPLCFNQQTSVIIDPVDVFGGNGGPYSFSVNNFNMQSIENTFPLNVNGLRDSVMISIFDNQLCRYDTTVFVTQPQQVQVVFEQNSIEVQLGDSLRLNPTIIGDFPINDTISGSVVWTPPTALSDSSILNPIIRPLDSEDYTLMVTDINGCTGSGTIFIDVDKDRKVYIPNVFTPNGDGPNDDFRIGTGLGVASINYVRIYDRWGELVFSQEEPLMLGGDSGETRLWDGRLDGQTMNAGVFVYIVEVTFEDDLTLLYRGDVTILP
ncbi:MAG: gliding motility-associated C-terminal domain-containing protein [Saprospiraceae bacterium]